MKSHELVERINNGEIKDGTKIKVTMGKMITEIVLTKPFEKCSIIEFIFGEDIEFEIVEEHKAWFKPKCGEFYFVINAFGGINFSKWANSETDLYAYKHHNCFRTEEEAQEYLGYKNALKEAEKPFKYDKGNYCIEFDEYFQNLYVTPYYKLKNQGITYLGQDKQVAQAFIDKWKPQILKFEFDVWE